MILKLRNLTPAPFRRLPETFHSWAVVKDGRRVGTILYHHGSKMGDPPDRWKATIQPERAFTCGPFRPQARTVEARLYHHDRQALLQRVRTYLETGK